MMITRLLQRFICAGVFIATIGHGWAAEEASTPDYLQDSLTGDWNGQRTDLYRQGIAMEAGIKLDSFNNLHGGIHKGSRTMSNIDLKLRADLERLWDWQGATAFIHVIDDRGSGINTHEVGSLMGVSNIEVPVGTSRLFHGWIQQSFMDEQWSLLAGLYPIDSEFSVMDSASVFIHPAYGPSADLALTRGPSIFNNSAAGLRLKWQSENRTHYGMLAVLDGMPGNPDKPKGTHVKFAKGDGSFTIAEFGWTPIEFGHTFEPTDPGDVLQTPALRTHYKYEGFSKYTAGAWRYSNKVNDQLDVDASGKPEMRSSWGAYLFAERSLWNIGGNQARHISGFIRPSFTDGNSTPIRAQLNLGMVVRGPLASRPDDILGLAWTRAKLASKYRTRQFRNDGLDMAQAEEAVELTYRFAVTPWLAIQPDLQWIRNPGGGTTARDAVTAGLRLEILL